METKLDFIYLSQEDLFKLGVTDMKNCIKAIEESFSLFDQGNYILGGVDGTAHGCMLFPPESSPFEHMPLQGPDRRFMAMPSYLGGSFPAAGCKWYGSNRENLAKGLPRSIHLMMVNDSDTGAPLAVMEGHIISSMRTGAVPGVGAKYLANQDSEVIGVIGCGGINRACFLGIKEAVPALKYVKLYDISTQATENFSRFIAEHCEDMTIEVVDSVEAAVRESDIVSSVTSGAHSPEFKYEWLKDGVYISFPSSMRADFELIPNTRQVTDCVGMLREWVEEGLIVSNGDDMSDDFFREADGTGAYWHHAVKQGRMKWEDIDLIGAIVNGKCQGRKSKDEKIIFTQGGLPLHDVAWAREMLIRARRDNAGIKLPLWEEVRDL